MVTGINDSKIIPVPAKDAIVTQVKASDGQMTTPAPTQTVNPAAIALANEIKMIKNVATTDASKAALVITMIFSGTALASTLLLPREVKENGTEKKMVAGH
jgi:hypothetical protein